MMDEMRGRIMALSSADRRGGRLVAAGPRTLELFDCMEWDGEWTHALAAVCPELCVSVRANRSSLSGYVVRFEVLSGGREWVWHVVLGLMLACCLYVLWPYWSFPRERYGRI
jgi:hypothetical protein